MAKWATLPVIVEWELRIRGKLNMSRRSLIGTVVGIAISVCLCSCTINVGGAGAVDSSSSQSGASETNEGTDQALINEYLGNLAALGQEESAILNTYDSVSGENYTDDLTMYNTLISLLPRVQSFIAELEALTPSDETLSLIHNDLVTGWNLQSKGMTLAVAALKEQDVSKIAEGNEALAEGRALLRKAAQKTAELK
ncbi:hypothetical protein [Rhodoluna sp.]|uniref:hypothetical protein n=1 Tax=Rhodoluna sp. TaxID=1969481 RepID=UPI0025E26324|nr:hypothetical protein [Rhodoluna sp.]